MQRYQIRQAINFKAHITNTKRTIIPQMQEPAQ